MSYHWSKILRDRRDGNEIEIKWFYIWIINKKIKINK
jgi:hypothetical protein